MSDAVKSGCLVLTVLLLFASRVCLRADTPGVEKADEANKSEYVDVRLSDRETMRLVKIPAGKFLMGSDPAQGFRIPDGRETPRHEVAISRDFYMGVHEVTRGQFAAFVEQSGYFTQAEREGWGYAWDGHVWDKVHGASWKKVGFYQTDSQPVICIAFDDAVAFCRWLGEKTGKAVLLPTEAQWEYACRAGTTTAYVWGDDRDGGQGWANAADETAREKFRGWRTFPWADGCVFTSPVGKYRANAFGLFDMIGNVWEWCSDWYEKDYYKTAPNVDPTGPSTGNERVVRGGSWMSSPPRCRSAGRMGCALRGACCDTLAGFRVVIEQDNSRKLPEPSAPNRPDWPDWRGPRRDAISSHVPQQLPEKVKLLWSRDTTGPGLSGVSVSQGRVIVADKSADGKEDIWRCLDADSGREIWQLAYAAAGDMPYTNSPRATPVVHDGKVYLLGAFGHLHCVRADSGKPIWKMDLMKDFGAALPTWGMTATPLIVDETLIVNPGAKDASLAALDRHTGAVVWKTPGAASAYASFVATDFRGQRQIVGYDAESLGGWNAATGERVWRVVPEKKGDYNVPTPIAIRDRLFVSTENNSSRLYGFTGKGYRQAVTIIERPEARFDDLAPDMITPVVCDGMIFGCHNSFLYCLDADTLKLLWKARDKAYYSYASMIAGNGRVMILTLDGLLLLVRADREKYDLVSRLKIFDGEQSEIWSYPALVKGRLYIRGKKSVGCLLLE